jgi:hypothetical protein
LKSVRKIKPNPRVVENNPKNGFKDFPHHRPSFGEHLGKGISSFCNNRHHENQVYNRKDALPIPVMTVKDLHEEFSRPRCHVIEFTAQIN